MTAAGVKWQCVGLVSMETTSLLVRLGPGGDPASGRHSGRGDVVSDQEAICVLFTHNPPLVQCRRLPCPPPHEEPALQTGSSVRNLVCPTHTFFLNFKVYFSSVHFVFIV